jgi:hypothetical protein
LQGRLEEEIFTGIEVQVKEKHRGRHWLGSVNGELVYNQSAEPVLGGGLLLPFSALIQPAADQRFNFIH